MVAERYQAFVTASVMPEKMCLRHIKCQTIVKYPLKVLNIKIILVNRCI